MEGRNGQIGIEGKGKDLDHYKLGIWRKRKKKKRKKSSSECENEGYKGINSNQGWILVE